MTLAILVFAILKSQETIGQVGVRAREQSLSPKHLKEIFKSLQIDNGDASLTPEKFNNFLSLNADLISHSRFTEARTFLEDRLKAVNKGNPIDYNKQVSILMKLGEIEMRAGEFKKSRSLFLRACHAAQVQGLKNEAVTALEFLFETTRAGHKFAETEEEKLFWIKDFNDNLQILETLDSQGISDI